MDNFHSYFDHTLLKPDAMQSEIEKLCSEALEYKFFSVCVNPHWIPVVRRLLTSSSVKTCTVVGFPLGANLFTTKIAETEQALAAGAEEIDCVINIGALKSGDVATVKKELAGIVDLCQPNFLVKVIVESGILTDDELATAIKLVSDSGAEFIKTSTGFAAKGASPEAVSAMKQLGRPGLKIKASGGIRTAQDFKIYSNLGVDRIGASRSVEILKELRQP